MPTQTEIRLIEVSNIIGGIATASSGYTADIHSLIYPNSSYNA